jgi:hypothetical protein
MADHVSMITLISILAPIVALVGLDVLAVRYGAESRPGFDERLMHDRPGSIV